MEWISVEDSLNILVARSFLIVQVLVGGVGWNQFSNQVKIKKIQLSLLPAQFNFTFARCQPLPVKAKGKQLAIKT
jgi:hypothetical protein